MDFRKLLLLVCVFWSGKLQAQPMKQSDYRRARSFQWDNLSGRQIFNAHVEPIWFSDSSGFAYFLVDEKGRQYFAHDLKSGKTQPLFNHTRLADNLSAIINERADPFNLIIGIRQVNKDSMMFDHAGVSYTYKLAHARLYRTSQPAANDNIRTSPDKKWDAFIRDYNLFIRHTSTGEIRQLTIDGRKLYEYANFYGWSDVIEGEDGIRPEHLSVRWSPDSKWIQTYIIDMRSAQKMYLLDHSRDTAYRAALHWYYRGSPGDTNVVYNLPVLINIETGARLVRDEARLFHTFPAGYEWIEDGMLLEELRPRGFKEITVNLVDVINSRARKIYNEKTSTSIDNYGSIYIKEWNKLLITSERSGWKQLYLLDMQNGKLQPLTNGNFYVSNISYIDKKARLIYFLAAGKEAGRNPYKNHLYRVGIAGEKVELLTPEDANHEISFSPDGKFFIDNFSFLDKPTTTVLRMADGKLKTELSRAKIASDIPLPKSFTYIGRDEKTVCYGALWLPSNFDSTKSYPIIDQAYTGPHTQMVPRNFLQSFTRNNQALAELGFAVVAIDGMGTAGRSKAFRDVSYKNMGQNLLDHVLAIRQLGERYKYIDTNRVGIFGHSAGGFDAGHAVLEFPNFYKVAVATSADHDFRMEKAWWPEMYMGWPVDSTYHNVSNITMAANLKGKLLIVHGGIDENVNPSATFKLAEALVKANKDFDMLILPSQRHGYTGMYNQYVNKKRWNYFIEHLLGREPLWDY